ncbi:hypothetical protein AMETH_1230 [Amycolatopsis methanolica 239]|uniref:Peptidase inhibitor family I36 n=1 Tax=Amycolatopsis methanolica 239 TaxID=1068978 RepID=A0A076MU28_AMYME|nr:hypothetical protein AMETH_1230 [Amycolatopsis methanolica 239]
MLLPVLAIAFVPATAAAQEIPTFDGRDCPQDSLCLYRDHGFTGGGLALRPGDRIDDLATHDLADRISSWTNDTGVTNVQGRGEDHFPDRRPGPARMRPAVGLCPDTGRGRLSYERAEYLFKQATRALAPAGRGFTLRQLWSGRGV